MGLALVLGVDFQCDLVSMGEHLYNYDIFFLFVDGTVKSQQKIFDKLVF